MSRGPLILYVPGLKPKPERELHREQILRVLTEGLRRVDPAMAAQFASAEHGFELVSWTYDFYGIHRDIELDLPDIEEVLEKSAPSDQDIAFVTSRKRRFLRWAYRAADMLPFLIPQVASEDLELQLKDVRRYSRNENNISEMVRSRLKLPLRTAAAAGRPVLLFGHSMGSVIAYDTLWQLSRLPNEAVQVDLFVTTGSPLGQNIIQRRILGCKEEGVSRYPTNIRRWTNIAAIGELTAIDMELKNDFGEMVDLGLVEAIDDLQVYNYYRMAGELNVHTEYGYLINEVTAKTIAGWWSGFSS